MECDASRNACSRTSSSMPGCSGRTTSSPGASRENAIRPGPLATVTMCGMPPSERLVPGRLEGGERDGLVFPEQHVVLEVDAVLGGEGDLGHGDQLAFDLAGALARTELGHVAQPGRLAPSGVADLVPNIERRTACHATGGPRLVLRAAPPTLDCFHGSKT